MLMFGFLNTPELIVIVGIIVLLFGARKLPGLAKGLGQGIKEFKHSVREEPKSKDSVETERSS